MFQLQTKREYFCAFFCICSFIAINYILLLHNKFKLSLHIIPKLIFNFSLIRDFFIIDKCTPVTANSCFGKFARQLDFGEACGEGGKDG